MVLSSESPGEGMFPDLGGRMVTEQYTWDSIIFFLKIGGEHFGVTSGFSTSPEMIFTCIPPEKEGRLPKRSTRLERVCSSSIFQLWYTTGSSN